MILHVPREFRREMAHPERAFNIRFSGPETPGSVPLKTWAWNRQVLGARLDPYPSPTLRSDPPGVRPPLSRPTLIRRQPAENIALFRTTLAKIPSIRRSARQERVRIGVRTRTSRKGSFFARPQLRWPHAATRPRSARFLARAAGPSPLPCSTPTSPPARLSAPSETSPIASAIQSAAKHPLTSPASAPGHPKTAVRAHAPGGHLSCAQPGARRPRRDEECSRRS